MAGEKGVIRDSVAAKTLKHAHTAALLRHEVLLLNGSIVIAVNASIADVDNAMVYRGKIEFPKLAALAIAPGEVCYWDDTNREVNKTSAANTKVGICVEDAAASDSVVIVALHEN